MICRHSIKLVARSYARTARKASTLVVAEHDGEKVSQGTLACITAASKLGGEVCLILRCCLCAYN